VSKVGFGIDDPLRATVLHLSALDPARIRGIVTDKLVDSERFAGDSRLIDRTDWRALVGVIVIIAISTATFLPVRVFFSRFLALFGFVGFLQDGSAL
jgi:hypothetical protein